MRLSQTLPSGARSSNRKRPPTRISASLIVVVNPRGPNHFAKCSLSVHARKTRSRGASNTRERTISRSRAHSRLPLLPSANVVLLFLVLGFGRFCLQVAQVFVQSLEALFPRAPRVLGPRRHLLERFRPQPTRPALR